MRSTIILLAVMRASGRHGSGLICPISKLYATEIGSQPITSLRPMELKTFIGRARPRSLCGLVAMDLGCNAHRVVRIQRDVGIDGMDHYFVVFQVVGGSTIIQNDRAVQLAVGDAALLRLISAKRTMLRAVRPVERGSRHKRLISDRHRTAITADRASPSASRRRNNSYRNTSAFERKADVVARLAGVTFRCRAPSWQGCRLWHLSDLMRRRS